MDVATMMDAEALRDGHLDEVSDKGIEETEAGIEETDVDIEETEVDTNPDVEGGFLTEGGRDWLDEGGMDLDETMEQDDEIISSGLARAVFDDWDDYEEQQEVSPLHQKSPSPHQQAQSHHQQQSHSQDQHACQSTTDLIRGVPSSHIHPVLEQYCENTEQNIQYLATYLQILAIKDTGHPDSPYEVVLSDGVGSVPALLAGHLADLVRKGRVRQLSVVRIHLANGHPRFGNLTLVSTNRLLCSISATARVTERADWFGT